MNTSSQFGVPNQIGPNNNTDFEPAHVRNLTGRRVAQEKMFTMIRRIEDQAKSSKKVHGIVGEDFFIAHNSEFFSVYRKGFGTEITDKFIRVVTMFSPEAFCQGFTSLNSLK